MVLACPACAEREVTSPSSAAPTVTPPRTVGMSPVHGGSVLLVGDQWVEVVTRSQGAVEVYFVAPVPAPSVLAATDVTVKITDEGGEEHDLLLAWNDSQARFDGHLDEAMPRHASIEVFLRGPSEPVRRARTFDGMALAPSSSPPPATRDALRRPVSPGRITVDIPTPRAPSRTLPGLRTDAPHPPPPGGILISRTRRHPVGEVVERTARDPGRPPAPSRPGRLIMPHQLPRPAIAHPTKRRTD